MCLVGQSHEDYFLCRTAEACFSTASSICNQLKHGKILLRLRCPRASIALLTSQHWKIRKKPAPLSFTSAQWAIITQSKWGNLSMHFKVSDESQIAKNKNFLQGEDREQRLFKFRIKKIIKKYHKIVPKQTFFSINQDKAS